MCTYYIYCIYCTYIDIIFGFKSIIYLNMYMRVHTYISSIKGHKSLMLKTMGYYNYKDLI